MRCSSWLVVLSLALPASATEVERTVLQERLAGRPGVPVGATVLAARQEGAVLHLDLDPGEALDPHDRDALLSAVDHAAGEGVRGVYLRVPGPDGDLVRLDELFEPPPVPDKPHGTAVPPPPSHPSHDLPGWRDGALADKTVYLSQCHGWYWHDDYEDWYTQRPNLFDTVEDFHNPEGMNQYLMRYLLNAGARVVTVKESDLGSAMVIVDDGDGGYTEAGTAEWADSVQPGFASGLAPYPYGTDPFELGGNRYVETDETATASATWVPQIPADGSYQVYVSYSQDGSRAPDAHYIVTHAGGTTDAYVDQRRHGSTWVYLGRFPFRAGQDATRAAVTLSNDSSVPGSIVSADAVRFGGGEGDVSRGGQVSGHERWEEAAVYYTQFAGAPTSVYDPYGDGDGSDPSSRSRFADWEHESGEDAIYLSWHSNACGDCGASGTSTYVYGPCGPGECNDFEGVEGSWELAEAVQGRLVETIDQRWQADWPDRGVRVAWFSEVSPSNNDETPAALVELAFHDTESDTALLKHPRFRRDVSRAMLHGIIDYFAGEDGVAPAYPPEPPIQLRVQSDGQGSLEIAWDPPPSGAPLGDPAVDYRVYLSLDGRGFDDGADVDTTTIRIEGLHGYEPLFVRVTAVNDGGESFPTATLGAIPTPEDTRILLVDGFDRLDRGILTWRDAGGNVGWVTHMDLDRMNRYDYAVEHLDALAASGVPVDAVEAQSIAGGGLATDRYELVVWFAGNESTEDETFSSAEQAWIADFVDAGGRLFVSGAEIGWDLDYRGEAGDLAFYEAVMLAGMAEDDADTYTADPEPTGIFAGLGAIGFDDGSGGSYDVRYPDVLDVLPGATPALYYDGDPSMPAALVADDGRLVYLGFPFETVLDPDQRDDLMAAALAALLPGYVPPEWPAGDDDDDDATGDDDDDDDAKPAPYAHPEDDGCRCTTGPRTTVTFAPLLLAALLLARRRSGPVGRAVAPGRRGPRRSPGEIQGFD